jgi:hypothetical protein
MFGGSMKTIKVIPKMLNKLKGRRDRIKEPIPFTTDLLFKNSYSSNRTFVECKKAKYKLKASKTGNIKNTR